MEQGPQQVCSNNFTIRVSALEVLSGNLDNDCAMLHVFPLRSFCYLAPMDDLKKILEGLITPRRMERMLRVLNSRLGALRIVVENLYHPHNMNAVIRTAEALGVQHVHVVEPNGDFSMNRKITKGSHKWLTTHRYATFAPCAEELRAAGFRLYAAMPSEEAVPLNAVPVDQPLALVFGNESFGISESALAHCDGRFVIPMSGFVESFNISVAAAISIYDVSTRMRRERPDQGLLGAQERAELLKLWLPKAAHSAKRIEAALKRQTR